MRNLFRQPDFDAFVQSLAGTSLVDQWESRVAKVGGKVFTLLNGTDGEARIVVKVTEESFEILTALDRIEQAPYFAKRKWLTIRAGSPLSEEDLAFYVTRSHALVAAGLTRKLRAELGISL